MVPIINLVVVAFDNLIEKVEKKNQTVNKIEHQNQKKDQKDLEEILGINFQVGKEVGTVNFIRIEVNIVVAN